jgi:hypothetical protein
MISKDTAVKLVPLLAIGICDQLAANKLTIREAEQLLFSPHAMRFFGSIERSLEDLIHAGTELDDINELTPESLPQVISDLRSKAASMLANGVANESAILEHWFEKQAG